MANLGGKDRTSVAPVEDVVEIGCSTSMTRGEATNEEGTMNTLENNEGYVDNQGTNIGINISEDLDGREDMDDGEAIFIPQVPCQYQPTLIQYNEKEECTDFHFGLIRGYHNEMYDEQKYWCLCCSLPDKDTTKRITRKNRALTWQICSVIFGVALVFIGLILFIVSFVESSYGTRKYLRASLRISSAYIDIIAIVGVTVLAIGSALVSLCLLVPVCVFRRDIAGSLRTAGDMYVKNAEQTYNLATNQFLYLDAALYRKLFGKAAVKKVQPELEY